MPNDRIFYFDIFLVCIICVVMLLAMSRASRMPCGFTLVVLLLLLPFTLTEEFIFASGSSAEYLNFHGSFLCFPLFNAVILMIVVRQIVRRKKINYLDSLLYWLPLAIFAGAQVPIISMARSEKMRVFAYAQYELGADNYIFLFSSLVHIAVVVFLQASLQMMRNYRLHLAEHVAEIERYRHRAMQKLLFIFMLLSLFAAAFPWIVLAQGAVEVNIFRWQLILHVCGILMIAIYLIDMRYFAPALEFPIKPKHDYSTEDMLEALKAADKAVIRVKAYKKLGVRLPQLAHSAKLEPELLAYALKSMMNISFRVFIFKYRLEYAKKLLLLTTMSVSDVAKSLGFKNQTYLSEMFDKYMQIKLLEFRNMGKDEDLVDWD